MSGLLSKLTGLFSTTKSSANFEASMNFDLETVEPFLNRLVHIFDSGINAAKVKEMTEFTKATPVESQNNMDIEVVYKGKETLLKYGVFMDDIDAPDLYFFTSKELAEEIQNEMSKYADELGI